MTGMILLAVARTSVGKLTYYRASYWPQLDMMLEKEQ